MNFNSGLRQPSRLPSHDLGSGPAKFLKKSTNDRVLRYQIQISPHFFTRKAGPKTNRSNSLNFMSQSKKMYSIKVESLSKTQLFS